jgi:hypothetical protein
MIIHVANEVFGLVYIFQFPQDETPYPDADKLYKYMKEIGLEVTPEEIVKGCKQVINTTNSHAACFQVQPGLHLIHMYKWENTARDYSVLIHEIFHGVDLALRSKGLSLSDDSDETWAYCIQHLTHGVLAELWEAEAKPEEKPLNLTHGENHQH